MKRYSSVIILLISGIFQSISQPSPGWIKDSLDLENSKRIVVSLKDSAKVDLMNKIAQRTGNISSKQTRIAISFQYATEALKEANRIGYKAGIAKALLTLSATSKDISMNMPGEIATKEKFARQARLLSEEINNYELLGWCYYELAGVDSIAKRNNDTLIAFWKRSIDYFLKARDTLHAAEVTNWLYNTFEANGKYETAFDYANKARVLSLKSGDDFSISWKQFLVQYSAGNMSELYSSVGDFETAMNYMREDNLYAINNKTGWLRNGSIAELFCQMGQYDSALVYWKKWRNAPNWSTTGKGHQAWGYGILGQIYLNTNQYDKAIEIFSSWSDTLKKFHPAGVYGTIRMSLLIGEAHQGKKNYEVALQFGKQGFQLAQGKNNRPEMMRAFQLLSQVYHHLGNNDSAYEYIIKYNAISDSIQSKQFLLRIYNSKKEAEDAKRDSRIGFLNRDNQIKKQQLKQQATFRNFLIAVFIAIIFAGLYVFRNITLKRKNEKLQQAQKEQEWKMQQLENENKHAELQRQAAELEMQALRAQMNPHFIFNCLSSINRFILKNESKIASNYLTRFSRLIRMVLMNSQKPLITLENELEMLGLYLEMERLRFKNSFDYGITFLNTIDAGNIFIPPLLLQPFCENAIWHGLMHLPAGRDGNDDQGRLDIVLTMQDKVLNCIITDNGIGREKAEEMKSKTAEKEKSMGLKITKERLALLNREKGLHTFYQIEDLKDENGKAAGTKVILNIRFKESVEETV